MKSIKMEVYYDGSCTLCLITVKNMKRLDWFKLVNFINFRESHSSISKKTNVSLSQMEAEMYGYLGEGKIVSNFETYIALSLRLPLGLIIYPLLMLLKLTGIARPLYNYIAKRRMLLFTGKCQDQCIVNKK